VSNTRDYITDLTVGACYNFTVREVRKTLGVSQGAAKVWLCRIAKRGLLASPVRGSYIIVPQEYKWLGSLPAHQFLGVAQEENLEFSDELAIQNQRTMKIHGDCVQCHPREDIKDNHFFELSNVLI